MEPIYTKVAGTTFYPVPWDQLRAGKRIYPKREPENPYDSRAIALFVQDNATQEYVQIGHFSKAFINSTNFDLWMDEGHEVTVTISEITGGTDGKANFGINLEVTPKKRPKPATPVDPAFTLGSLDGLLPAHRHPFK